jgi:hypothetical protein
VIYFVLDLCKGPHGECVPVLGCSKPPS